ncbi:MAG: hypothetical protein Q4C70_10495, partial [Planctomycetia bacterium]|nr:hypothetical protein [Planctomycetia bacterium]
MIHQFYFTHCTYATSALERKSGEVAPHPLGYSVRAGSVQGSALREIFRRLERYVYYYLPSDTPGNEKESLNATTAPVRLIFLPDTDCGAVLMNLCYRAKDTAGRVGSYFGHALAGNADALEKLGGSTGKVRKNEESGKSAFNAVTALQLWGASNWVCEDADWFPHDLSAFESLADVLGNASPAVDEKVLHSFLTTEPGGAFHDPRNVIPQRWRKMLVSERQHYFKTALYGFLSTYDTAGETLLLAVEPSVAALMFYGVCLFFPQTITRSVSFSTFEPLPDRLFTKMAATTFMEPTQSDLNEAVYHGRSFVLNTWNGRTSNFKPEVLTESYVSHVWKQFLAGGIPQVSAFCRTFSSVGVTAMSDLKAMMDVENVYHQIMADEEAEGEKGKGKKPLPTAFRELPISGSRMAVTLLKRRLADGVAKIMALPLPEAEKRLSRLIGTPGQLLFLELLGKGGNLTEVQGAVRFLTENLPEKYVGKWLKQSSAGDDYKAQILERWLTQTRTLPVKCDFLWSLTMEAISAGTRDALEGVVPPSPNAGVLPMVFAKQSPKVLMECFQSPAVEPFQKEMVLAYTWGVSQLVERHGALNEAVQKVRQNLDKFIQQVPEYHFGQIYYTYGNWFFLNYPGDSMFLGEKFTCLESDIFRKPEEIGAKLKILFDIQDILPEGITPRVRRWSTLQKAMLPVTTFQAQPGRKIQSRALDQACETLAQKAYDVFDDVRLLALCGGAEGKDSAGNTGQVEYERIGKISNAQRNRLVERQLQLLATLCKQWYNVELLPTGNRTHELMQKKLKYYLQTRNWNNAKISALGKRAYILMALGGVGIGLVILLVCLLLMMGNGGTGGNAGDRNGTDSGNTAGPLVVSEDGTLVADDEEEDNSSSKKNKKKKKDGKSDKKGKKSGKSGKSGNVDADSGESEDLDDSEMEDEAD